MTSGLFAQTHRVPENNRVSVRCARPRWIPAGWSAVCLCVCGCGSVRRAEPQGKCHEAGRGWGGGALECYCKRWGSQGINAGVGNGARFLGDSLGILYGMAGMSAWPGHGRESGKSH
jgi:hypothetical protein